MPSLQVPPVLVERPAHVSHKQVGTKPPPPINERQADPGAPGDSASSEDLINAGEALLETASDLCGQGLTIPYCRSL